MAFATGVAKRVIIAEESTFGTSPVTGGQYLRRVSSDLSLNKDSYESQEIVVSQQLRDARHGVRRPGGTFSGQISPGSFTKFWEGLLRNTFTATAPLVQNLTLDPVAGTLTGTNLLASNLKKNDGIRLTGVTGANATLLNGTNLRVSNITATVITVLDLPTGCTAGALGAGCTVTMAGKKLWTPQTGQLYKSYSIEHWFSDIAVSELFKGCRFGQTTIGMPSTGLVTFNTQVIGQDMLPGVAQQLTNPTDSTSTASLAAVNGKMTYNGVDMAMITGITLQIVPALEANPVIGSNIVPWIFMGMLRVTGTFTALFMDETLANIFVAEQEVSVSVQMTTGSAPGADFMRFSMPRVKAMSSTKSDGQMSLIQNFNFTALENVVDASSDLTTLVIQDSTVP